MDRRKFLKSSGLVAGAAAASTLAAPAIAQDKRELKMVTSWPKNFPGLGTAPEHFAKILTEATDGRISVRVFAGGELVPPLKVNDAVQEGTADLYHSCEYYFMGKSKAYGFFTAVPLGLTAPELDAWLQHGGGQQLWDEVAAQFNIKPLQCGNTGTQMGGWFKNPITSLDDLKGLKMRIPGMGGDVLNALGGTSVTLAGSEILPALQSGTIDATEWVGPWNDLAFGLHKVVKNYHYPGFHEPGTMTALGFNKGVWDSFSAADQKLIEACAIATNNWSYAQYNANNAQALDTLVNQNGVNLVEFPDEVYKGFFEASEDVINTIAGADELTGKVAASFKDFRQKSTKYTPIAEQGFLGKRAKFLG